MATMPKQVIVKALESLNANYGRGDVVKVDFKKGVVHIKKQYGEEFPSFRVEGGTVYFRDHQMTFGSGGAAFHNPASGKMSEQDKMAGPADEAAARELILFIENDGDLYRQQGLPIIKNLVAKVDRGIYDRQKAVKLYMYLMESGSRSYAKQFSTGEADWKNIFNKATRELAAKNFVAHFESEYKAGAYSNLHAKKYASKAGVMRNPPSRHDKWIVEKRRHDGSLDLTQPQPGEFFGLKSIHGMTLDQMAKSIFKHCPDAELRGTNVPSWPKCLNKSFVARLKTW